jgi:hypothetical protein
VSPVQTWLHMWPATQLPHALHSQPVGQAPVDAMHDQESGAFAFAKSCSLSQI